jgi:hypothetical protein
MRPGVSGGQGVQDAHFAHPLFENLRHRDVSSGCKLQAESCELAVGVGTGDCRQRRSDGATERRRLVGIGGGWRDLTTEHAEITEGVRVKWPEGDGQMVNWGNGQVGSGRAGSGFSEEGSRGSDEGVRHASCRFRGVGGLTTKGGAPDGLAGRQVVRARVRRRLRSRLART